MTSPASWLWESQSGYSQELWVSSRRSSLGLCEYKPLFDSSLKAYLSQTAHEGPAWTSKLSDVSGQAAKDHSLWLEKGKQARQGAYPGSSARGVPHRLQTESFLPVYQGGNGRSTGRSLKAWT